MRSGSFKILHLQSFTMKINLFLIFTLILTSCGTVEISRHRHTGGFHISINRNNSSAIQKNTKSRQDKKQLLQIADNDSAGIDSSTNKSQQPRVEGLENTLPSDYQLGDEVNKTFAEPKCKQRKPGRLKTLKIIKTAKQAVIAESSAAETSFTGTHAVVLILTLILIISFLIAHNWIEAILFLVLLLIALAAASLEFNDCCLL